MMVKKVIQSQQRTTSSACDSSWGGWWHGCQGHPRPPRRAREVSGGATSVFLWGIVLPAISHWDSRADHMDDSINRGGCVPVRQQASQHWLTPWDMLGLKASCKRALFDAFFKFTPSLLNWFWVCVCVCLLLVYTQMVSLLPAQLPSSQCDLSPQIMLSLQQFSAVLDTLPALRAARFCGKI